MHFCSEANRSLYTAKEMWWVFFFFFFSVFFFFKFIFKFQEKEQKMIFMKEGVCFLVLRGFQITCICASKYFCVILLEQLRWFWSQTLTSVLAGFGLKLPASHSALSHVFLRNTQSPQLISNSLQGGPQAKRYNSTGPQAQNFTW